MRPSLALATLVPLALSLSAACGRGSGLVVGKDGATSDVGPATSDAGPGGNDGATGGTGGPGSDAGPDGAGGSGETGDPGWTPIRHLTNYEYDRTVSDLLGVEGQAVKTFQSDEAGDGFDVVPLSQAVNDPRVEGYMSEAERLAQAAFVNPTTRARIVTCHPAANDGGACARGIVTAFGLRAWRRPLAEDEITSLVALADGVLAGGGSFEDAMQDVVTALLTSAPFLYRMEIDADPTSRAPRALTPHELASRLSYLLWSSMPDDRLFRLAGDGTLSRPEVLRAEVDRMIDDPRSVAFADRFGGSWFSADELESRQVDPTITPKTADPWWAVQAAMAREVVLYVAEFLHDDRSFATLLDADFNVVNAPLARYYGLPADGLTADFKRVDTPNDRRKGLLGLAGTLLVTATSTHTSPFHRGEWILERLLCQPPTPFGGTEDGLSPDPARTFRARVRAVSATPACAGCHAAPDGLGLGLEEFDATGAYRGSYKDGTPVDSSGTLPDGTPFVGEAALAELLANDPRFLACATRQALKYALNRPLGVGDEPRLADLVATWTRGGATPTLRALLEQVTASDAFRFRRGEGTP